jgi:hypothetical protein
MTTEITLRVELARAVELMKQAHAAQLHPRNALAVVLAEEIRRHEPNWQPPESAVGR